MFIPDSNSPAQSPTAPDGASSPSSTTVFSNSTPVGASLPYNPTEHAFRDSGDFTMNGDLDFNSELREEEAVMVDALCSGFPAQMQENPSLVSLLALIMLRFRDNDLASAKERLGNYLVWRAEMFGNLNDHYLHDDPVMREQLRSGFLHVFVDPEPNKPALMYAEMKRHIPKTYTAEQTLKCWHYLIFNGIRQNMNIIRSGFIVLQNLEGCGMGNSDSKIPEHISQAVQNVMPIRVLRVIFYKSPTMLKYLFKFVKFIFSTKIQDRMVVTSTEKSLTEKYGINPLLLPVDLGGKMIVPTVDNGRLESSHHFTPGVYV